MPRRPARSGALTLLAAASLALGGCGGDPSSPGSGPASSPSTSSSTSSSSSSPPMSSAPTSSGSVPAGTEVSMNGVTFQVPAGYRTYYTGKTRVNARGRGDHSVDEINVGSVSTLDVAFTVDQLAREHLRMKQYLRTPARRPDVEVDGRTLFHFAGMVDKVAWVEAFGEGSGDYFVDFELVFDRDEPASYRQQVVDQLLATVRFA